MAEPIPQKTETPRHAEVAQAIEYLVRNYADQPSLDDVARAAGLSPHHFQRTFKTWTGVSPKRFLQYVTLGHARNRLEDRASVLDASYDTGLSGPGRLHDLFVACEAVTPGDVKRRGQGLVIRYGFHDSPFGRVLTGVTDRGIIRMGFVMDSEEDAVRALRDDWPAAELTRDDRAISPVTEKAFRFFLGQTPGCETPEVFVMGTNFQIKVWEALIRIPRGHVVSYQDIARAIGQPGAVRAIGRAVGSNPIALLIPCHRVILKSGVIHNYRWGTLRKRAVLAFEEASLDQTGLNSS
ncbi:MAG: bifunctional helix-turn-helix domain-containing protein/methylated-DNA--[protein]-cysteine S-methyltransferase [Rhodospirillales bacterium]|nr:bifunctional helix-turn-helix domain-containing protein/methylated-DNA--[protein]-cysteine S-methyltransferase [Alphaproteobacteria bacterium]MBL6947099.1 bifunctional helix-turn-helix domain-containing protein/methylated-DNA--[protein]-cysteine S-methyltransferase [Rhodospirillales bacterium]